MRLFVHVLRQGLALKVGARARLAISFTVGFRKVFGLGLRLWVCL